MNFKILFFHLYNNFFIFRTIYRGIKGHIKKRRYE